MLAFVQDKIGIFQRVNPTVVFGQAARLQDNVCHRLHPRARLLCRH